MTKLHPLGSKMCIYISKLTLTQDFISLLYPSTQTQLSGTSMGMSQVVLTRRLHHGERADAYQGFLDHHAIVYKIYCSYQHEQF